MSTIRVLLIDDQQIVREGLVTILKYAPGIEVVGQAGDGREGVALTRALEQAAEAENRFQAARRVMFESNIRLVFYIAGKFVNNGLSLDDLVQEGSIGLLRAVEKFDYRLGYKFSTYASTWIWQAVTRAIANQRRTVRVPAHLHDKMLKVRGVAAGIEQRTGHSPRLSEIADEAGLPETTFALSTSVTS